MATAAVLPHWTAWSMDSKAGDAAMPVSSLSASAVPGSSATMNNGHTSQYVDTRRSSILMQDSNQQYTYSGYTNNHMPSTSNPSSTALHPTTSSSLFSRSELQAIDGFLESFSAPSLPHSHHNNDISNSYALPNHPQPLPYSSSTAFYRPDYEAPDMSNGGWRRGPPTAASTSAPTYSSVPYGKYASYHPTAYHRPASPSSASASSSSYPKTLAQADQAVSTASGITVVRPPRLSNSPFSSTSHAEESPDDREKRLRSQANDLAGWLSRYNNPGQPQQHQPQRTHHHTTSNPQYPPPSNRSSRSYHESSAYSALPEQMSGPGSIGSTSNSDSLPTPSSKLASRGLQVAYNEYDPNMSGLIRPSDLSLSKQIAPQQSQIQATPPPQAVAIAPITSTELNASAASRKASVDSTVEKGKTKAAKHAGPAKKKTSSTTAGVRERKKPIAKAPSKSAKAGTTTSSTVVMAESLPDQQEVEPSASTVAVDSTAASKAALSEEQKRANHIASEQKRRHAIRAAYDALCTVVPSLSAAVKEYEDRLSKLHPSLAQAAKAGTLAGGDNMDIDGAGTLTPVQTVAGVLTGGIEVGGEKIDGRAGPRSEAVVLAKTVEYMRDLLDERETALARVQQLRAQLQSRGASVPAASLDDKSAPWNIKWNSRNR